MRAARSKQLAGVRPALPPKPYKEGDIMLIAVLSLIIGIVIGFVTGCFACSNAREDRTEG